MAPSWNPQALESPSDDVWVALAPAPRPSSPSLMTSVLVEICWAFAGISAPFLPRAPILAHACRVGSRRRQGYTKICSPSPRVRLWPIRRPSTGDCKKQRPAAIPRHKPFSRRINIRRTCRQNIHPFYPHNPSILQPLFLNPRFPLQSLASSAPFTMHRTYSMRKSRAPTASQIEVGRAPRMPLAPLPLPGRAETLTGRPAVEPAAAALEHKAPSLRPQWTR